MTQQPDRVRQYLRRRGCTPSVIKGGLDGLVSHWESCVAAIAEGYDLTLSDYLHDMEYRDVLQGTLEFAASGERSEAERQVEEIDHEFRELTVDCGPLGGEDSALEHDLDPANQWWYFRRPRSPAPDFEEELREAGLV